MKQSKNFLFLLATFLISGSAQGALTRDQVKKHLRSCEWTLQEHDSEIRDGDVETVFGVGVDKLVIKSSNEDERLHAVATKAKISVVETGLGPSSMPLIELSIVGGSDEESRTLTILMTYIQASAEETEPVIISVVDLWNDGPNETASVQRPKISLFYRKGGTKDELKKVRTLDEVQ